MLSIAIVVSKLVITAIAVVAPVVPAVLVLVIDRVKQLTVTAPALMLPSWLTAVILPHPSTIK